MSGDVISFEGYKTYFALKAGYNEHPELFEMINIALAEEAEARSDAAADELFWCLDAAQKAVAEQDTPENRQALEEAQRKFEAAEVVAHTAASRAELVRKNALIVINNRCY